MAPPREARAERGELDGSHVVLAVGVHDSARRDGGGEPASPFVVDVHDGDPRPPVEQPGLGLVVGVHRPVEVQVLGSEVGEDPRSEGHRVDPAQIEAV